MHQLIELAKKKPQWLRNEGYWRILQIARLAASASLFLLGLEPLFYFLFEYRSLGALGAAATCFGLSIAAFWIVPAIAWTIVWVRAGFKGEEQAKD